MILFESVIFFPLAVTSFLSQTRVIITNYDGDAVGLGDVINTYFEATPEPGTFVLAGSALGLVGLLKAPAGEVAIRKQSEQSGAIRGTIRGTIRDNDPFLRFSIDFRVLPGLP